ncbi:NUDIX hydrolase [Pseudonocardiaceae bacterium YIM PH 21723]|nr:NUDIX hydrolase [Pseudonocardiaceae bacterium YIM PH 21723]
MKAAGAVLWRPVGDAVEIAVVHRPQYDDWSLPKGKLDKGETMPVAAHREVVEETGYECVLGRYLGHVSYEVASRGGWPEQISDKVVRYFSAEAVSGDFVPNDEVDELRWVSVAEAVELLTYSHDQQIITEFDRLPARTRTLLLVRHAKAGKRAEWDGPDAKRPLTDAGREQAASLAVMLPLFGADQVYSAPRVRCTDTVVPLAKALGTTVQLEPLLSEEGFWPVREKGVLRVLDLLDSGTAVVCSQGGVIPDVVAELATKGGVPLTDTPAKKGSVWLLSFSPTDQHLVAATYLDEILD